MNKTNLDLLLEAWNTTLKGQPIEKVQEFLIHVWLKSRETKK